MKDILRKNWIYLILLLVLVVLTYLQVKGFRFGFFTAYDEAYFLLKLQEAYDMSCITGKSQWNLIAIHWFPYLDLTSKVNSYLASSILIWVSVVVATTTLCLLYNKKNILKYFTLSWFFMFGLGGGLSYVPMQTAVLIWVLCAFMLYHKTSIIWKKSFYAMLCGIFLGFSIFIIIPAALVLLMCIAGLIVILHWGDWRKILLYIGSGVLGVLLTILYVHIVVCPLDDIYEAMLFTATYISKSGYNYDGVSFVVQYALFFRDCLFVIFTFVGTFWLSKHIKNKWIGGMVYILMILIYTHYQIKPIVSPAMFMMSLPLVPFLFNKLSSFRWDDLKKSDTWYYLFIFAYPFIAAFGTNVELSYKISNFVIAWLFIWFDYEYKHSPKEYGRLLVVMCVLYAMPLIDLFQTNINHDESYHFTRGNKHFAEIALTEKQVEYFNNVYDILEEYNFQPKESAVLTAAFDYCCLYAFDAVNASNYHQVQNFHYFPKENMIEPDFIFLCQWDSIVMGKELAEMPWGWPEEFDSYYVGTPEPDNASWVLNAEMEHRHLYCRKSLKKHE